MVLAAPCGYGKSTAVSQWLAGSTERIVWLSAHGADRDPAAFVARLAVVVDESIGDALGVACPSSDIPEPFVVVIDHLERLGDITGLELVGALAARLPRPRSIGDLVAVRPTAADRQMACRGPGAGDRCR